MRVLSSSAQKYRRMPRFLSAVTTLSSVPPTVLTQTWRTFLSSGAIQASRFPPGEICGDTFSGFPNRTVRGMRGGASALSAPTDAKESAKRTIAPSWRRGTCLDIESTSKRMNVLDHQPYQYRDCRGRVPAASTAGQSVASGGQLG